MSSPALRLLPEALTFAPFGGDMQEGRDNSFGSAVAVDERALIIRLRAGDEQAFEAMVRTFGGRLLAVARRFVHNEEDAQDIVQSAYLSALRGLEQFEGNCHFRRGCIGLWSTPHSCGYGLDGGT